MQRAPSVCPGIPKKRNFLHFVNSYIHMCGRRAAYLVFTDEHTHRRPRSRRRTNWLEASGRRHKARWPGMAAEGTAQPQVSLRPRIYPS